VPRPPADALAGWLLPQPWITLDSAGLLRPAAPTPTSSDRTDRALTDELDRHPDRPTTTAELIQAFVAAGYTAGTGSALLSTTPILRRVDGRRGHYRLRTGSQTRQ